MPTHKILADLDVGGEVKGTSLDINGAADISGNLSGVDTLTCTDLTIGSDATTSVGKAFLKLGDVSVVSYVRVNANETLSYLSASQFLSAIGGVAPNQDTTGLAANATNLNAADDRDMAPEDYGYSNDLRIFFSTKEGLEAGSGTGSNYQDVLYLNSYADSSGGSANILAFDKSEMKIYHYQAAQTASNWGTAKELAYTAGPTFTGTPAAPTAGAGTNTTQLATTAFVTTAVSNLVDSAPGALNTLNELAAAINDDASFSTTITNSIAAKLPLAGGTMTGNIAHASDFTLDVGGDIILDADGAEVILADGGTQFANLKHNSGDFEIKSLVQDKDIKFIGNDNNSDVTALTLDMSEGGNATFAGDITLGANHIGRDGDNYIGFESDNLIKLRVNGATQVKVSDGVFSPQTDSDVDLGTNSVRFKDAYIDTITSTGAITAGGQITGTELEGTSLDINGNADISGNLTGVDTLTATIVNVESGITHDGDVNNKIAFTTDTQTFSCDGNESLIIRGNAVTDEPLFEINGAGAGNQLNIGLLLKGVTDGNPIKMKMQAPNDSSSVTGAGILSYEPDADEFNIGQSTTHNNMAISIDNSENVTFRGNVSLSAGALSITGDGSNAATLTESGSGDFDISTVDDLRLTSGGNDVVLRGASSSEFGRLTNSSQNFVIQNTTSNKDIIFKGSDGGSTITALTLDISEAGKATFNNDVVAFSDRKLKENIETLDGKKVLDMRGVSFTRKDTGLPSSGVIAQEIQEVAPELVNETNGTLGVSYGNLVGYLIEAVKDQQKQIDELKEIINGSSR